MKISCIICGQEVNLDHVVFQDYDGPVKCFYCGTMMKLRSTQGAVDNIAPLEKDVTGQSPVAMGGVST
jgi:DNA-directed RNA polymerase subunit RPC12/RpoP